MSEGGRNGSEWWSVHWFDSYACVERFAFVGSAFVEKEDMFMRDGLHADSKNITAVLADELIRHLVTMDDLWGFTRWDVLYSQVWQSLPEKIHK